MKKIFLAVVLMFVGGCALAQKPERDTARMEMKGTFASFEFDGADSATYYVDWGDGVVEKIYNIKGVTQGELEHTYTASNTYTIKFWGDKEGFVYDEGELYTETITDLNFTMDVVYVQGGTFTMGCMVGCYNEKNITLPSYYISKYEITQAQYKAVMGENPSYYNGDNLPVERVTYYQAKSFCEKLSAKTGKKYALPTEAQWEFAARGGNKSKGYEYSGSNTLDDVAWYDNNSGNEDRQTHIVGTKYPNELGLYDMSGNVSELCADNRYTTSGTGRAVRGGGLNNIATACRVLDLGGVASSSNASSDRGFRVVCLPLDTLENEEEIIVDTIEMVYVEADAEGDYYYISKYEITQAQYKVVMGENPSYFKGDSLPVESIDWDDAKEFCNELNKKTGKKYALPTEAQWEFAARGGNKSKGYEYSGSNTSGGVAWHADNSGGKTHIVGTKAPNELGIYDMSGNVEEWCEYDEFYNSDFRRIRGGSWNCGGCERVLYRASDYRNRQSSARGFRVVCLP